MSKAIYVNVPVKDVAAAQKFYTKLGFSINQEFTTEQAANIVIDENIGLMLLDNTFFEEMSGSQVADTSKAREVSIAISVANRDEVNTIVDAAVAAGGTEEGDSRELDGMYSRGVSDLDGHRLDIMCMPS